MAAPWSKILGIIGNVFQFDTDEGPILKNNAGVVEHKNASDAAFVITRGADPVGDDDLVTKRYFDATPQAGDIVAVEVPFDKDDQGGTVDSTFAAAVGGRLLMVKVDVTEAFDQEPASFEIGDTGDSDKFVIDGDVKLDKVGLYEFPQYTDTIASVFRLTIGASGAQTTGAARALFYYTVPIP